MKYYKTFSLVLWIICLIVWILSAFLLPYFVDDFPHSESLGNDLSWLVPWIGTIVFMIVLPVSTIALFILTILVDILKFRKWKNGFVHTGEYVGFRKHTVTVMIAAAGALLTFFLCVLIFWNGRTITVFQIFLLFMVPSLIAVIEIGNAIVLLKIRQRSVYGKSADKYVNVPQTPPVQPTRKFGPFDTYKTPKGGYIIKGDAFDRYLSECSASNGFDYVVIRDDPVTETVPARFIEGIRIGETEMANPNSFWSMHKNGGTEESFKAIASHIPEVSYHLNNGKPLSEIIGDKRLGECASIFFSPSNIPNVIKCNGYYVFESNGRHRILAARELGFDIPVHIVGIK